MRGIFFPVLILSLLIGMEYYMFQCLKLIFPPKDGARFSVFLISYLVFSIG
jgi:hypothetical protein